ncbi:MAG TPA: Zn-dependent protease, partial [Cystobacter sp.]
KAYSAAEALAPGNAEMVFWHAVSLVNVGKVDEAVPLFQKTYKQDARWKELLRRLPKAGLIPDDPKLLSKLLGPAR